MSTGRPIRCVPRLVASGILLFFGASHAVGLLLQNPNHDHLNPVFPFLTNRAVFAMAALLLLISAAVCLRSRLSLLADVSTAAVLGTLVWYRISMTFLDDGGACGCSGAAGIFLGLSAMQEETLALAGLAVLGVCLLPAVAAVSLRGMFRLRSGCRSLVMTGVAASSILFPPAGRAHSTLLLSGTLSVQRRTPLGPAVVTNASCQFLVELGDRGTWRLQSTNSTTPGVWSTAYFDGKDTYLSKPSVQGISDTGVVTPDPDKVHTQILPGPLLFPSGDDLCRIADLWLVFCTGRALQYHGVATNAVHWPVPLWMPRWNPRAWMFRWHFGDLRLRDSVTPWVGSVRILRDISLDNRKPEQYMLLPELDYPQTPSVRERFIGNLRVGMAYTNGAVGVSMSVSRWGIVGDYRYPEGATVIDHGGGPSNRPHTWVSVVVEDAVVTPWVIITPPPPAAKTTGVDDYRYRRKDLDREFSFAAYTLASGGAWPSDHEPELLAAADAHMREAFTYRRMMWRERHYVAWLGFAFLLATPLIFAWIQQSRKKQNIKP